MRGRRKKRNFRQKVKLYKRTKENDTPFSQCYCKGWTEVPQMHCTKTCKVHSKHSTNQQTLGLSRPLLNISCIFSGQLVAQTKKGGMLQKGEEKESWGSTTKDFMTMVNEWRGRKASVCKGGWQRSLRVKSRNKTIHVIEAEEGKVWRMSLVSCVKCNVK